MLQSTWHALLAVSGLLAVAGLILSESSARASWPAPPLLLAAGFGFGAASLYSSRLEVVSEGQVVEVAEPAIGVAALGAAVVCLLLALLSALTLLTIDNGESRNVYQR
jgi:hypothetical protein